MVEGTKEPSHKGEERSVGRYLWLGLGHLFLILGVLGIFLPLLPTTPFLILTAACYSRGSERLEAWLINHPRYGPGIRAWRKDRSIPLIGKQAATVLIALSVGATLVFGGMPTWVKASVVMVVVGVLGYIWSRPTAILKNNKEDEI